MYDSVFLASDEILRNQEGRKAIILIRMEWIIAARSRRRRRWSSGRRAGLVHPVLRALTQVRLEEKARQEQKHSGHSLRKPAEILEVSKKLH